MISYRSFRPRHYLIAVIALVVGTAAAWCVMWTITAAQYHNRFDAWIDTIRAHGSDITYDDRSVSGFPGTVAMNVTNLRWHNAFGAHAEINELTLSALPFNARKVKWHFNSGMTLTLSLGDTNQTAVIRANEGEGSLRIGGEKLWKYFNASLTNITGSYVGQDTYAAALMSIVAERPTDQPKDHSEVGMDVEWLMNGLTLSTTETLPFGKNIDHIEATMHVMGTPPNPYDKAAVAAWNSQSGILECEDLKLDWGPLQLYAKGTLGLDDDLQPEGAFAGAIGNHEKVIQALLATNWIPKRQAGMLNSALTLFSRPSLLTGKPSIELPITVQLGGLFLGPVRIFTFPDIPWPVPQATQAEPAP